jgi:hypothetical protein
MQFRVVRMCTIVPLLSSVAFPLKQFRSRSSRVCCHERNNDGCVGANYARLHKLRYEPHCSQVSVLVSIAVLHQPRTQGAPCDKRVSTLLRHSNSSSPTTRAEALQHCSTTGATSWTELNATSFQTSVLRKRNPFVRFEVFMAVTMNNDVFWDIKTKFLLHRRNIISPLHSPAS